MADDQPSSNSLTERKALADQARSLKAAADTMLRHSRLGDIDRARFMLQAIHENSGEFIATNGKRWR